MRITPQEIRFDTRSDYAHAIDTLLLTCRRQLCVFDPDLRDAGFENKARADTLVRFLAEGGEIRMVLHDPDHLQRYCPRLLVLLARYGHRYSVRQTPADLRLLTDCFVLGDEGSAVIRFHADHFRGKLLLGNADETQGWWQRFEQLWESCPQTVASTRLGL